MSCLGRFCKKKSPAKSPTVPNLPMEMLREIAQRASPKTRRTLARAMTPYTRRTMPIGLAVTKVGAPAISPRRPPVINRSVARAKPVRGTSGGFRGRGNPIDYVVPAAYKNPNWRYYMFLGAQHILFLNSPNGRPYLIDKKTGRRRETNVQRKFHLGPLNMREYKPRTANHTWQAYLKRAEKARRYAKGSNIRMSKFGAINQSVERFLNGNRSALNRWTIPNLAWWAKGRNWMQGNGEPYVKIGGRWHRYGGAEVTRQDIINDIRTGASMRNMNNFSN